MARAEDTAKERFYERLLELHVADELAPVIADALHLLVEITGASAADLQVAGASWSVPGASSPGANVVLRVPIGLDVRVGMITLHRETGVFSTTELGRVELFARQLALLADRVVRPDEERSLTDDIRSLQAQRVRLAMVRHRNNVSAVSRELRISRMQVYRVLRRGARDRV